MIHLFSVLEIIWKSDLLWLFRPLDTILAFLGHNVGQIGLDFNNFDPVKTKFQNVMIKSFTALEIMWNSGLVWLSRPLNTYLAIWANFGPIWANISQRGWGTPTFFWSPRLYLPIGT